MTEHEARMIALLDQGESDAVVALEDLKALWAREDEQTAINRRKALDAHERGSRDRQEARKHYTADDVARAAAKIAEEEAAEARAMRAAEAVAKRMSSLPVSPLAALEQTDKKK